MDRNKFPSMTQASLIDPEEESEVSRFETSHLAGFIHSDDQALANTISSLRRSSLVKKLRLGLPLIAGLIIVVMFTWSAMDNPAPPQRKEKLLPQTAGHNELLNPRFESEDTSQQPYTITATKAFQDTKDTNLILLNQPVGNITLKDKTSLNIKSEKGAFQQTAHTLQLEGNVKLLQNQGYEMATDKVNINMTDKTAVSKTPVEGHGPMGTIHAQGMTADGKSGIVTFQGPATMTINQSDSQSGDQGSTLSTETK